MPPLNIKLGRAAVPLTLHLLSMMDKLKKACDWERDYPLNIIYNDDYHHTLQNYYERLNVREKNLFWDKKGCSVDFWELNHEKGFSSRNITSIPDLKDFLWEDANNGKHLPRCRFMFMTSPHSRERLKLSRDMMSTAFSYHQVLPCFLDFIYPFGKSEWAQDFEYSAFRHQSSFGEGFESLAIPEIGRSGAELRLCYSFKSVETSKSVEEWPWSIRTMAVYHTFDVHTGHSEWIILKGNNRMKSRIISATSSQRMESMTAFNTVEDAFSSTLKFHNLFCDWSAEGWRWYINFLEEQFQTITRQAMAVIVDAHLIEPTQPINLEPPTPTTFFSSTSKSSSWRTRMSSFNEKIEKKMSYSPTFARPRPQEPDEYEQIGNEKDCSRVSNDGPAFSFSDLQKIQHLEEKANETSLVIEANISVVSELQEYYSTLDSLEDAPLSLKNNRKSLQRMTNRLQLIQKDLQMQLSRAHSLLKLLGNRKALLYAILEYRNMETNRILTAKTQQSTDNMEVMTGEMHKIARKTQQETVSMRIITLVTLFFLPGTFISTIMSTDIVRFEQGSDKNVSYGALTLYLTITLPLMVVTFAGWYAVYWWANVKNKSTQLDLQSLIRKPGKIQRVGTA
ncbi:hypothetical protein B0J11DRAFT_435355 [Dendryphion nanum]|uniref:CorA-like transporter domain-containing protein n=1 Tax=Dendryphion nanum TaxID=256645 RepID=A0A9P9DPV7_9PLEO|nr:hypothetical protein B0J11DRAFT_435355 [Dendryphion nanum]